MCAVMGRGEKTVEKWVMDTVCTECFRDVDEIHKELMGMVAVKCLRVAGIVVVSSRMSTLTPW